MGRWAQCRKRGRDVALGGAASPQPGSGQWDLLAGDDYPYAHYVTGAHPTYWQMRLRVSPSPIWTYSATFEVVVDVVPPGVYLPGNVIEAQVWWGNTFDPDGTWSPWSASKFVTMGA